MPVPAPALAPAPVPAPSVPDLRDWLVTSANINEKIVDRHVQMLEEEHEVFTVDDLRILSGRDQFDEAFKPVTAEKIRTALAAMA